MQKSTMSRYLSEHPVMGFLANDNSEQKEITTRSWILLMMAKKTKKKYVFSCDTWQTTPSASNADRVVVHNVIQQSPGPTRFAKSQCSEISNAFTLFLRSSLSMSVGYSQRSIVYGS